jgi:hypothetical protein
MAMGKHYGSFGKGFADGLIAMIKLSYMRDYYKSRRDYYDARAKAYGQPKPGSKAALDAEGRAVRTDWEGRPLPDTAYGGKQETPAEGKVPMADMVKMAEKAGFKGDDAAHMAALAQAESGGNPGAVGKAGEIGLTQINPHAWPAEMVNAARDPQGAFNAAYKVYQQQGWKAWSTDPSSPNFTPGNNGMRFFKAAQGYVSGTQVAKGDDKPAAGKPRTETVSAKDTGVKPGWDKIVNPTTDAEDKAAEAYKRAHPDWQKQYNANKPPETAQAGPPPGSYQVAGDNTIALSPEEAERARADLEAHRVPLGPDSPATSPQSAEASDTPDERNRPPAREPYPAPSTVDPQDRTQDPAQVMTAANQAAAMANKPDVLPSKVGRDWSEEDQPALPPVPSPRPIQGPPQRTGAPPNVGITPSSVPEPVSTQNTVRPEPPTPVPVSHTPIGGGEGNKMEGPRGTPTADAPSVAAQPVSATRTVTPVSNQPGNQPGGGRFVPVERPNLDQANPRGGGPPMMTALNLSNLFGPNPPLSQQGGGGQSAPSSPPQGQILSPPGGGPTPYPGPTMNPSGNIVLSEGQGARGGQSVPAPMPPIRPDDLGSDVATASRKGGPIQRFAHGGIPSRPTIRLQTGGAAPASAQYPSYTPAAAAAQPGLQGNVLAADEYMTGLPGMTAVDLHNPNSMYYTSYGPGQGGIGGQELTADWSKMTPDQLAQYNAMTAGTWQPPAATPTPTPAPAAATPTVINPPSVQNITNMPAATTIVDPTTTTTTGAPGVPNAIQAKSYDPNVDAQTGAGFSNTSNTGGTNYSVGTNDLLQTTGNNQISGAGAPAPVDTSQNKPKFAPGPFGPSGSIGPTSQQILSRKGGPIQRFNRGGIPSRPMMGFAAGGGAAASSLLSPNYSGPVAGGGWAGTPYADMAPNQQTWATNQETLLSQEKANANNPAWAGWSQLSGTPAAVWPTTTPAAPTPLNEPAPTVSTVVNQGQPIVDISTIDPTATTTTGIPGVANAVQAKSYDPNVDAQTGAGFTNTTSTGGTNYSVGSNDLLQTTGNNQISGAGAPAAPAPVDTSQNKSNFAPGPFGPSGPIGPTSQQILSAKGGPIPRRNRRPPPRKNYTRYDLGGGVDQSGDVSASALGMPPGLGQGGAQPIPPYYYNPATYSGAGAPVGKGVTQTSVPTFTAGAIPSLPMARGGTVYKFDDGGDVPDESAGTMPSPIMDEMQDQRDEAEDAQREQGDAAAAAAPGAGAGEYDQGGKYFTPPDDTTPPVTQQSDRTQPQGHGPYRRTDNLTPQIKDDQGNPSRGLIDAISGGLQWIAAHVGLGSAQAAGIAGDPTTQTARMNFASGKQPDGDAVISHTAYHEGNDVQDPGNALDTYEHKIAGMEGMRLWMLNRGDIVGANKMGASQMQYSAIANAPIGEEAARRYYDGNLKGAMDALNEADNNVVDGRHITFQMAPDGKSIVAVGSDLNARQLWVQRIAPHAILAAALGYKDQSATWKRYEDMAVRYDPAMKAEFDARNAEKKQEQKEADARARGEASEAALGPTDRPYTPSANASTPAPAQPSAPAPGPLQVNAPAAPAAPAAPTAPSPGKSPDSTTAQTAAPPPTADSSLLAKGPTGHGGAIPSQAGPNITTPDAQEAAADADFKKIAASLDQQEHDGYAGIRQKYVSPDGNPILGNKEILPADPNRPRDAAWQARDARWREAMQTVNQNIASEGRDLTVRIASQRDALAKSYAAGKEQRGAVRAAEKEAAGRTQAQTMETTREEGRQKFETGKEMSSREWEETKPRGNEEVEREVNMTPDPQNPSPKDPNAIMAQALGYVSGKKFDIQKLNNLLTAQEQTIMSQALVSGFHYSPTQSMQAVADMVTGMVVNHNYVATAEPLKADKEYGVPRSLVTVHRLNDNGEVVSTGKFALPEEDYRSLRGLIRERAAAEAKRNQAPPPEVARPPSGPAPPAPPIPSQGIPTRPNLVPQVGPRLIPRPAA